MTVSRSWLAWRRFSDNQTNREGVVQSLQDTFSARRPVSVTASSSMRREVSTLASVGTFTTAASVR